MPRHYLLASMLASLLTTPCLAQSPSDTLPIRVVERAVDAYKRKDLDAAFADYDTVFVHESLGDSRGSKRVRRTDWLGQLKSDSGIVRMMNTWRITHIERGTSGPWVFDIWTLRGPKGQTLKRVDMYEVHHGKIVREIES